ncbi:MAG: bifunctional riboflavin kinase/FMN adenylyltransferase, partial [Firmicutes bacterium]|nr:bifunctional riboflavin kinase/FMN adenylyltransferase [Bacillota bacterium]
MKLLETYGADVVCVSPFTQELRDMAPEAFVQTLRDRWHPRAVVVGYNYNFGRHGAGNPGTLRSLGAWMGFETAVVAEVRLQGERVSSTRIRQLLA